METGNNDKRIKIKKSSISGFRSRCYEIPTPVCSVPSFQYGWTQEREEDEEESKKGCSVDT